MKATGVVRRIDDLGRIVIPKEIRRTLRLREGTPLEIFTDREGEIILKKYSPMAELGAFASQCAEALAQGSGHMICVTDRDQVLAVAGGLKKDCLQKPLSRQLEQFLDSREVRSAVRGGKDFVEPTEGGLEEAEAETIAPILCQGDVIGTVILLAKEAKTPMGEMEQRLAVTAAGFLGRQMEG